LRWRKKNWKPSDREGEEASDARRPRDAGGWPSSAQLDVTLRNEASIWPPHHASP
jgi:hypothetical protein